MATSLSWSCTQHLGEVDANHSRLTWKTTTIPGTRMEQTTFKLSLSPVIRTQKVSNQLWMTHHGLPFLSVVTNLKLKPRSHALDTQLQESSTDQLVRLLKPMPSAKSIRKTTSHGFQKYDQQSWSSEKLVDQMLTSSVNVSIAWINLGKLFEPDLMS